MKHRSALHHTVCRVQTINRALRVWRRWLYIGGGYIAGGAERASERPGASNRMSRDMNERVFFALEAICMHVRPRPRPRQRQRNPGPPPAHLSVPLPREGATQLRC